ncbi:MAG: ABC transporter ATP-binding protein [Thermomicrobiales bacterium]
MSAVQFAGVNYAYPGAEEATLSRVDWEVNDGEFVVVAGPSGSGKSTLLRCLNGLVPHFAGGRFGGVVTVRGLDTRQHGPRVLSRDVGFVFQDPEAQIVTGRVEDEIAFGLEQLGVPPRTMRKRVEELLDLLGIADVRDRETATLSGGERQRVAVASALALQPRILVLDEPTSQLDPWGAEDVLTTLTRLNEELGLTVVLAEHRLERVVGHADRMRVLQTNDEPLDGAPRDVLAAMTVDLVPPMTRLGRALDWRPLPLTIREGRRAVAIDGREPASPATSPGIFGVAPVLRLDGVSAGYGRRAVLRDLELEIRPGELVALMGRNGSGKTTLLRAVMGFHRPVEGRIVVGERDATALDAAELARDVGYLPQNPGALLFSRSVRDELRFTLDHHPNGRAGRGHDPAELLGALGLDHLADQYPRDLSAGEQERTALASILVAATRLLLLDEPTRGMDAARKRTLGELLTRLCGEGVAVILATHDVEMVAQVATRVVLLGGGEVIADGTPREVLSGSLTYSTQINKLYGDGFLTVDDVLVGLSTTVERKVANQGSIR